MAQTKMISRIVSNQRQRQFYQQQQQWQIAVQVAAAADPPPLAPQAHRKMRAGVKNIEGRIHNITFKI